MLRANQRFGWRAGCSEIEEEPPRNPPDVRKYLEALGYTVRHKMSITDTSKIASLQPWQMIHKTSAGSQVRGVHSKVKVPKKRVCLNIPECKTLLQRHRDMIIHGNERLRIERSSGALQRDAEEKSSGGTTKMGAEFCPTTMRWVCALPWSSAGSQPNSILM